MKDKKVRAIDILRMIPCEELAKLSLSTKVDYCAKALSGERVFYLLVYAFLAVDEVSQRKLETVFNTDMFKTLFNISLDAKVTHGSISTRLSKIDLTFFEKAYEVIYQRFSRMYNRVGGKRSSFLPTFVFRPLTPPYVPFGIRRFLSADAI